MLKRSYAQFGHSYVSTGQRLTAATPFPSFLVKLGQKVTPYISDGTTFEQCIITNYPSGAGIGWHTDADKFGDCIIGISLGGTARMQFRLNTAKNIVFEQIIAPGSIYVMCAAARWDHQHQIVPQKTERYSLTLRTIKR